MSCNRPCGVKTKIGEKIWFSNFTMIAHKNNLKKFLSLLISLLSNYSIPSFVLYRFIAIWLSIISTGNRTHFRLLFLFKLRVDENFFLHIFYRWANPLYKSKNRLNQTIYVRIRRIINKRILQSLYIQNLIQTHKLQQSFVKQTTIFLSESLPSAWISFMCATRYIQYIYTSTHKLKKQAKLEFPEFPLKLHN